LAIRQVVPELLDEDVAQLVQQHRQLKYRFGKSIIDSFDPSATPRWDADAAEMTTVFAAYEMNGRLPRRFWL
jgi:hypothetical protein